MRSGVFQLISRGVTSDFKGFAGELQASGVFSMGFRGFHGVSGKVAKGYRWVPEV